ncbi:hypothetical protein TTHERM_00357040 (macronuclear) [Tetrahymena thermophila SB210]|uniref:RING-type domain-containing protein n=1 Tax=Tetrahymena thermophila (strain SB210) TaxID=312017 RepID=Q22XW7_TETTS|nr:hypothetical protein TTHERM_00357040 [Tetrahymena thermophila SB210]EAR90257.2 hypothetical protein TTHERM_00357040 [Tetrahymena thermophila SB210]|eukprot:XP_001010502.2 hypothetical protein TTHERM_00357040 [Tetrahymena thermophila SB210]
MNKMFAEKQQNNNSNQQRSQIQIYQFDEILTCPYCLQLINDPHQPPCGHSFCKVCLVQQERCPCCLIVIPLNENQEKQISRNYMLKDLLENTKLFKCLSSDCGWSTYEQKLHQQHLNSCKYIKQKMVIIDDESNQNYPKFGINIKRMNQLPQIQQQPLYQPQPMYHSIPYQNQQNNIEYAQYQDQFGRNSFQQINQKMIIIDNEYNQSNPKFNFNYNQMNQRIPQVPQIQQQYSYQPQQIHHLIPYQELQNNLEYAQYQDFGRNYF